MAEPALSSQQRQGCSVETNWTYIERSDSFIHAKMEPPSSLARARFDERWRRPVAYFVDAGGIKSLPVLIVWGFTSKTLVWWGQVSKNDLLCIVMNPTSVRLEVTKLEVTCSPKPNLKLSHMKSLMETKKTKPRHTQMVWMVSPILLLKISFWLQNHHRSMCFSSVH